MVSRSAGGDGDAVAYASGLNVAAAALDLHGYGAITVADGGIDGSSRPGRYGDMERAREVAARVKWPTRKEGADGLTTPCMYCSRLVQCSSSNTTTCLFFQPSTSIIFLT
jgi:hypothetical protein